VLRREMEARADEGVGLRAVEEYKRSLEEEERRSGTFTINAISSSLPEVRQTLELGYPFYCIHCKSSQQHRSEDCMKKANQTGRQLGRPVNTAYRDNIHYRPGESRGYGGPEPNGNVCYRCKESGHLARECPNPEVCHGCGQSGHRISDCPEKRCFRCGEPGHISVNCRRHDQGGRRNQKRRPQYGRQDEIPVAQAAPTGPPAYPLPFTGYPQYSAGYAGPPQYAPPYQQVQYAQPAAPQLPVGVQQPPLQHALQYAASPRPALQYAPPALTDDARREKEFQSMLAILKETATNLSGGGEVPLALLPPQ
jgi:hypothetical protein